MRRYRRSDGGFTLTELLVSMTIFAILMTIVTSVMISLMNSTKETVARTQSIQQARIGVSQIDRQVRSGNVILDPSAENSGTSGVGPFFSMRIFTQEDGIAKCAQWRVIDYDTDGFGDLEYRTWDPAYPVVIDVSPWSAVARNLVRIDTTPTSQADIDPDDPLTWPPFWVDDSASGNTAAQFVRITLRLKDPGERQSGKPTTVSTVVTGRNTVFGYPPSSCSSPPAP